MGILDFIKPSYWFGGPDLTRSEVAEIIEKFLGDEGGTWDWDDLISIPTKDEELEMVRLFCSDTHDLYPPEKGSGKWCNEEGLKKLQQVANWLKGVQEKPVFLDVFDPHA